MTTTNRQYGAFLANRNPDDYPAGTCVAWINSADRVCGRPADYVCPRHLKVAIREVANLVEREKARRARVAAEAPAREAARVAELAKIDARLDAIDPMRRERRGGPETDPAMVNMPLGRRMPSDARISELAQLHRRRAELVR